MKCCISPIKTLPQVRAKLVNPTIEVGGRAITFPTELESGSYLEYRSASSCKVYDAKGAMVRAVTPLGSAPRIEAGANAVKFTCDIAKGLNARANITIISQGEQVIGKP